MKKSLLVGLAALMFVLCGLAHAAWNEAWPKRLKISIDTTASGLALQAAVESVPLLVRLHTGNFAFLDSKPDGSDLRFVAADDKTPLKHHIEKFDGVNELALVWVQVPRLNPSAKTDFIWLYYGNSAAAVADDAKGTYDAKQGMVLHFSDAGPLPQDATANANHAASSTARPSATGVIGGAVAFDGATELSIADKPSLGAAAAAIGDGITVSFWVKPSDTSDALLFLQGEGTAALRISLRGGKLAVQVAGATVASTAALAPGSWQHVAVVVKSGATLFVGGQIAGQATGGGPLPSGAIRVGRGFKGELDELQWAATARSADWIKAAAGSQGQDQKLLTFGPAGGEGSEEAGPSYLKILLSAVTIDGWIVIAILGVMFIVSFWVMFSKAVFVNQASRDNEKFKSQFDAFMADLRPGPEKAAVDDAAQFKSSSLYRLFGAGAFELRKRFKQYAADGRAMSLSEQSIEAIRAAIDARLVREIQQLNSSMVLLTISIAGGPFLGLLGTVVGVMITFAAIAAAGDVNVNAIAPGIAAALVATVAGLVVAIPCLFGYNYLSSKISELTSDMQVFIDEFITRIAETHSS